MDGNEFVDEYDSSVNGSFTEGTPQKAAYELLLKSRLSKEKFDRAVNFNTLHANGGDNGNHSFLSDVSNGIDGELGGYTVCLCF